MCKNSPLSLAVDDDNQLQLLDRQKNNQKSIRNLSRRILICGTGGTFSWVLNFIMYKIRAIFLNVFLNMYVYRLWSSL